MTDVFEGSMIRCMRRLEELLRQMCQASKAIGNTELENKFAEGEDALMCVSIPMCVVCSGKQTVGNNMSLHALQELSRSRGTLFLQLVCTSN